MTSPYRANPEPPRKLQLPRPFSPDELTRLWLYPLLLVAVVGFYYWLGS